MIPFPLTPEIFHPYTHQIWTQIYHGKYWPSCDKLNSKVGMVSVATYFLDFGTPSIFWKWVKPGTSNLVYGLIMANRPTSQYVINYPPPQSRKIRSIVTNTFLERKLSFYWQKVKYNCWCHCVCFLFNVELK